MPVIPVVMPVIPALERHIRWELTAAPSLILRFVEAELPFWTDVEVRVSEAILFSHLQVSFIY